MFDNLDVKTWSLKTWVQVGVASLVMGLLWFIYYLKKHHSQLYFQPLKTRSRTQRPDLAYDWFEVDTVGEDNPEDIERIDVVSTQQWSRVSNHQPIVLYFHGNAGNVENRLTFIQKELKPGLWTALERTRTRYRGGVKSSDEDADLIRRQCEPLVIIFDYPEFGLSTGRASLSSIIPTCKAMIALVRKHFPQNMLLYYGESIGTSLATLMAKDFYQPAGLVLKSPFSSIAAVVADHVPAPLYLLAKPFIEADLTTTEWIQDVKCPVLIFYNSHDTLISTTHLWSFPDAIPKVTLPGGHNDHPITEVWLAAMTDMFERMHGRKGMPVLSKITVDFWTRGFTSIQRQSLGYN